MDQVKVAIKVTSTQAAIIQSALHLYHQKQSGFLDEVTDWVKTGRLSDREIITAGNLADKTGERMTEIERINASIHEAFRITGRKEGRADQK